MINKEHQLPITKQCRLLQLSRSSLYYANAPVSDNDKELMRIIDEIYLEEPYLCSRGMRNILRLRGYTIGRIHARTLMRTMGIEALYGKPRLSRPHPGHTVYPYLLKGLTITEANHVWCSDITYIPMAREFCYLVAIMDWASRKVLSWRVSNTLDTSFCVAALEEAIMKYGTPDIFNTERAPPGSQRQDPG
jgi:putative transposase